MFPEKRRPTSALVVDDNPDTREFVGRILTNQGCDVHFANDGEEALSVARCLHPEVVYLDINMPEQDGWLVCAKLKYFPDAPTVVLMTGTQRDNLFRFAEFVKADTVLRKPFSANQVIESLPFLSA
jgi:CheY-like chemotaxis protein